MLRASSARSTGSGCSSTEPASRRDRSSRSTDSFCRRATCSLIVSRNSRRVSSSRSSSWSSSTNPASEKIGVRSSCDAVAMNSLRATSTCRSCACIWLKVRVSWPSSSLESTGSGIDEAPVGDLVGGQLQPAHAPCQRLRHEEGTRHRQGERHARGHQHAVAHQVDRLGDVVEVARVEHDRGGMLVLAAPAEERLGHLRDLLAAERGDLVVRVLRVDRSPGPGCRWRAPPSRCASRTAGRTARSCRPAAASRARRSPRRSRARARSAPSRAGPRRSGP